MDNGMDNMLDVYLYETNSLLEQMDELLLEAEKNNSFTTESVNEIFRIMHTIKGSSAMMEFSSVMTVAHHIEDLFFYIRENGMEAIEEQYKGELFNLMFDSTDLLRAEVEKVEKNEPLAENVGEETEKILRFLEKISVSANGEEGKVSEPDCSDSETEAPAGEEVPYCLKVFFDEGCGMENLRAFMLVTALADAELICGYRPENIENDTSSAAEIAEKGFLVYLNSKEDLNRAVTVVQTQNNIRSYEILESSVTKEEKPCKREEEAENKEQKQTAEQKKNTVPAHSGPVRQDLISVSLSKLDSLMALVGEIVITESMVTSSPDLQNLKLDNFTKSARQLRKLTDDLQDIAMSLRMVPVAGTFQKMHRIVRDMSKSLNKRVRLVIEGENTEVDKTIVDSIADPVMHIVRNSMDHGIEETEDERIRAGKEPEGEIVLSAAHTGSEVIISIRDDGRGIDPGKILEKAERNGLLTKPASEYSQKEVLSLLMLPGFSTNEEVTEYSGRGVGMDVVKKNVETVGGSVVITSEPGKGSCTTLKIPLTMAIVDGMEVKVGNSIFTIPIANIRQSFKARKEDVIYDASGNEIVKCMDEFYPIVRVHRLFHLGTEVERIEDGILMWVEAGDRSYCLFLDELIGEQQVVVKPLPAFLNSFNVKEYGISGCTILGDGNISIILDIAGMYGMDKK